MCTRIALFDVETNGLMPKNAQYTDLASFKNARIVQLAMAIYEFDNSLESYKLIKTFNKVILPDKFKITNSHIHNITHSHAVNTGTNFKDVINEIYQDLMTIDILVSHNINFDKPVFLSELYRYGFTDIVIKLNSISLFCSMLNTTKLVKKGNKPYKWPKLSELHNYLFNENAISKHDALADVQMLSKCFWQLYDLNLISIENNDISLNY